MLRLVPQKTNIDFLGSRKICLGLSAFLLAGTIALLASVGLNWGIDFAGGTLVQVQTSEQSKTSDLRAALASTGMEGFSIQEFAGTGNEYLIRVPNKEGLKSADVALGIKTALADVSGGVELRRTEFVGPQIGDELRIKGALALGLALLAILFYISARFEMRYALGAIAALAHDIFLTVGIFALFQKEVTMPVLAALLTIIGYSLNDTIVVFDRVRETTKRNASMPMVDVLNLSMNDMLNRTLMTSLTTLAVLVALFFLGGGVINDFAFTLMFGVLVGTYSSIFIASPVVLMMEGYYKRLREQEEQEQKF